MEGRCTDDSNTSDTTLPRPPPPAKRPSSALSHRGSGASVVFDPVDAAGAGADQAESTKKLPSSKYKGVVPQPNGRWGAQIYEKHLRVWLGTFIEEDDAARAYDVATQRFRGRDAVTNFKPLSDQNDAVELSFLNSHSKSEIVDMLRKHTYSDELHQSRRHFRINPGSGQSCGSGSGRIEGAREQLFEKIVTPSDVGKLNRLVIPKLHAEKHFPLAEPAAGSSSGKGVLLNFEDLNEKVWRFRYSYWNSSQSYVLTKGWSRFVKEKSLKAGDVVSFHRSTGPDKQLYINWRPKAAAATAVMSLSTIRLFGVDICRAPAASGRCYGGYGAGKRGREDDVVPDLFMSLATSSKKQMVVGALS